MVNGALVTALSYASFYEVNIYCLASTVDGFSSRLKGYETASGWQTEEFISSSFN